MPLKVAMNWTPLRGLERIQTCLEGIEVQFAAGEDEFIELLEDAEVAVPSSFDARMLQAAQKLRWIQFFSGGVKLDPALVENPIPVACLKGSFDVPATEFALAGMLAFARKLEYDMRRRPSRSFVEMEPEDIRGKTVGIVGLGSMGREIARCCKLLGMRVLGVKRHPGAPPEGVEKLVEPARFREVLAAADFALVAVPLVPETAALIGSEELECMKKSAYLIDITGRPGVYDLEALAAALRSGSIAGAQLQMVPEDNSPLWDLDNLILSYHRIVSRQSYDLAIERFCENLRRDRQGLPLLGLVDKQLGY